MAVTFDNANQVASSSDPSSFALTIDGSASYLIVGGGPLSTNDAPSGITADGEALSAIAGVTQGLNDGEADNEIHTRDIHPTPTGSSLTVQISGVPSDHVFGGMSFIGVNTGNPIRDQGQSSGLHDSAVDIILTTQPGDMCVLIVAGNSTHSSNRFTAKDGSTERFNATFDSGSGNRVEAAGYTKPATTTSTTIGCTPNSRSHAAHAFALRPAAGGNRAFMIFSEAWDRWRDRSGLLVPKGFNEPIWKPEPQILTPSQLWRAA